MAKMDAVIFNISRYMIEDGPGIRTTVFFKGCPLRCSWCSNPFGLSPQPEIAVNRQKCSLCGSCVNACPQRALRTDGEQISFDRSRCRACGRCAVECVSQARTVVGHAYSTCEVVAKIRQDARFYRRDGGGVTLSGGEVLMQASAAVEILDFCRCELIHTAVETSGYGAWSSLLEILKRVDLIFIDLKHRSDEVHRRLTGVGNQLILDNIARTSEYVSRNGSPRFVLRLPVIPGLNTDRENMEGTAEFIAGLGCHAEVNLLPYHQLGAGKYDMLNIGYRIPDIQPPSQKLLNDYVRILKHHLGEQGSSVSVGGWAIDRDGTNASDRFDANCR